MGLRVNLDDLSDEGLDLLLRIVLKTDERYIDSWTRMGALLEQHKIELSYLDEKHGWNAAPAIGTADNEGVLDQAGEHPKAAIARALILKLKPDGFAMRLPIAGVRELLSCDWQKNKTNQVVLEASTEEGKVSLDVCTNILE